jgi:hypothetical protein
MPSAAAQLVAVLAFVVFVVRSDHLTDSLQRQRKLQYGAAQGKLAPVSATYIDIADTVLVVLLLGLVYVCTVAPQYSPPAYAPAAPAYAAPAQYEPPGYAQNSYGPKPHNHHDVRNYDSRKICDEMIELTTHVACV